MDSNTIMQTLGISIVAMPTILMLILGVTSLLGRPLSESTAIRCIYTVMVFGLLSVVAMAIVMAATDHIPVEVQMGDWVKIDAEEFHFHVTFIFDRLSIPFVMLTFVLCGTIGAFTETVQNVGKLYPIASSSERLELVVGEHLLRQVENLQAHEFVRAKLRDGRLRLHCWLVTDATARVRSFNPHTRQFTPIEKS